jgi:hydrophobe/amphiphile efflux-3 (HAE3) family protein
VKRLASWLVDYPLVTGGLLVLVTVALGLQIPRLRIDESAEGLMVEHDPARRFYEQMKERFGSDNLTIVLVQADDVFAPAVLDVVRRLTEGLERIEGVSRVDSLASVKNIKGRDDTLDTEPLVSTPVPATAAEAARVRGDALDSRVIVGNLVSPDARATALAVYVTPPAPAARDSGFNQRLVDRIDAVLREHSAPGVTAFQVGVPLTKATYVQYLGHHLRITPPLGLAVLVIVLFVCFRTLQGVVIPLLTATVSIVWAVGLMAILGIPMTVLTGIIPSLLLAIGFTEDVHMLTTYHERLRLGEERLAAIRSMLEESCLAILVTAGTTIIGFASLVITDITMVVQFGYASALGLTANLVITLIAIPILLRVWPVPRRHRAVVAESPARESRIRGWMERLAGFNLRYRVPILVVTAVVTAISLIGVSRLRVNTDLLTFFPREAPIRVRIDELQRSLPGALAFYVAVDTGRADGIKDPAVLRNIVALQDFLIRTGKVDKTVSVADYLRRLHREMNGGDPAFETIPDTPEQVAQYLLLLEGNELTKYVDFNASAANVVVRHNLSGSADLSALVKELEAFTARTFPSNVVVRATGESILYNNAADYVAVNEVTSFAFTFVVIGLIHALLFMSLKAGFLSLIPNVIPIFWVFGLMGLAGVPLNTATAMIATIAVGIAVDDTVHHMVTYSRQLNEHHDQRVAMLNTMKSQGQPIIYVSLALAAGFFVSYVSPLVPAAQFGLFAALTMLVAMVCELMLTPILMYSVRLVTLWDLVLLKMHPEVVRAAPLLAGLSRWEARKVVLLGRLRSLDPGQLAIRKGDPGSEMYLLVSGRARVYDTQADGTERTLAVFGPGATFGEMALLTHETRSANVVAEMPSEILVLDFQALERIRMRFPYTGAKVFRNLAHMLSDRLRHVTADLVGSGRHAIAGASFPSKVRGPAESEAV